MSNQIKATDISDFIFEIDNKIKDYQSPQCILNLDLISPPDYGLLNFDEKGQNVYNPTPKPFKRKIGTVKP